MIQLQNRYILIERKSLNSTGNEQDSVSSVIVFKKLRLLDIDSSDWIERERPKNRNFDCSSTSKQLQL
jgi:hypothetical protein